MEIYKRFTRNAKSAMQIAYREAARLGHEYIGTEHFLLAIISMRHCTAADLLKRHNVDLPSLRVELDRTRAAASQINDEDDLPHPPRAKQVIEHAIEESRNFGHQHIGTEHILLGLLREADGAGRALIEFGLDYKVLRKEVRALRRD